MSDNLTPPRLPIKSLQFLKMTRHMGALKTEKALHDNYITQNRMQEHPWIRA
jgi:hypothetical protein